MILWLVVGVIAVIALLLVGGVTYGISGDKNTDGISLLKAVAYAGLALVTFFTEVSQQVDVIDGVIFVAAAIEATDNFIKFVKSCKKSK